MTAVGWVALVFSVAAVLVSLSSVHYARKARRNWEAVARLRAEREGRS